MYGEYHPLTSRPTLLFNGPRVNMRLYRQGKVERSRALGDNTVGNTRLQCLGWCSPWVGSVHLMRGPIC